MNFLSKFNKVYEKGFSGLIFLDRFICFTQSIYVLPKVYNL